MSPPKPSARAPSVFHLGLSTNDPRLRRELEALGYLRPAEPTPLAPQAYAYHGLPPELAAKLERGGGCGSTKEAALVARAKVHAKEIASRGKPLARALRAAYTEGGADDPALHLGVGSDDPRLRRALEARAAKLGVTTFTPSHSSRIEQAEASRALGMRALPARANAQRSLLAEAMSPPPAVKDPLHMGLGTNDARLRRALEERGFWQVPPPSSPAKPVYAYHGMPAELAAKLDPGGVAKRACGCGEVRKPMSLSDAGDALARVPRAAPAAPVSEMIRRGCKSAKEAALVMAARAHAKEVRERGKVPARALARPASSALQLGVGADDTRVGLVRRAQREAFSERLKIAGTSASVRSDSVFDYAPSTGDYAKQSTGAGTGLSALFEIDVRVGDGLFVSSGAGGSDYLSVGGAVTTGPGVGAGSDYRISDDAAGGLDDAFVGSDLSIDANVIDVGALAVADSVVTLLGQGDTGPGSGPFFLPVRAARFTNSILMEAPLGARFAPAVLDVGAGGGALYIVDGNFLIRNVHPYRNSAESGATPPGGAVRVDAGSAGLPWVVTPFGEVYHLDLDPLPEWTRVLGVTELKSTLLASPAEDIGVAYFGPFQRRAWRVDADFELDVLVSSSWVKVTPGTTQASRVSAWGTSAGSWAWYVAPDGSIGRRAGGAPQPRQPPAVARDVAAGPGGTGWIASTSGDAWRYDATTDGWDLIAEGNVQNVTVQDDGSAWLSTNERLYSLGAKTLGIFPNFRERPPLPTKLPAIAPELKVRLDEAADFIGYAGAGGTVFLFPLNALVADQALDGPRIALDAFGIQRGLEMLINVAPIHITENALPADANLDFNDVALEHFKTVIDKLVALPGFQEHVRYLPIGNEIDIYLTIPKPGMFNYNQEWDAYLDFYRRAAAHVKQRVPHMSVGLTLTWGGLRKVAIHLLDPTAPRSPLFDLFKEIFAASDCVFLTYYGLDPDPLRPWQPVNPAIAPFAFDEMLAVAAVMADSKPVVLQELGYQSDWLETEGGPIMRDEDQQAEFVRVALAAWLERGHRMPFLSWFSLYDWHRDPNCADPTKVALPCGLGDGFEQLGHTRASATFLASCGLYTSSGIPKKAVAAFTAWTEEQRALRMSATG